MKLIIVCFLIYNYSLGQSQADKEYNLWRDSRYREYQDWQRNRLRDKEVNDWRRDRWQSYQDYSYEKYKEYRKWEGTKNLEYSVWIRSRENVLTVIKQISSRSLPYHFRRELPIIELKIKNYQYETLRWDAKELALNRIEDIEKIYPFANSPQRLHLDYYKELLETVKYQKIPVDQFIIYHRDELNE